MMSQVFRVLLVGNMNSESDEARRRREQADQEEALMQQMLLDQDSPFERREDPETANNAPQDEARVENNQAPDFTYQERIKTRRFTYRQLSWMAAVGLLFYAFRTRQQYYLAMVFLSSSKWAYVVFGNALIASLIAVFDVVCSIFLNGLRLQEAEGLQDFFRWNVTETCLALAMFREDLSLPTAIEFLVLVLMKCLHHVAALRENHLRLTQESVVAAGTGIAGSVPVFRRPHIQVCIFFVVLQFIDLWALQQSFQSLLDNGPSVKILFAFQAAIMLVSSWSHLFLWYLHAVDGMLHFGHENGISMLNFFLPSWRDYKATLVFAVELQAQTIQFIFYLAFFSILLTYQKMPINLIREVYMSFAALRERLTAFFKYRQLMTSMNAFSTPTEDELEEGGRICIICRDEMLASECKCLPGCHHVFHKSCLREWLVQQQSCPTCRSDIQLMQKREASAVRQQRQHQSNDTAIEVGQDESEDRTGETSRQTFLREANDLSSEAGSSVALYIVFRSTSVFQQNGNFIRQIDGGTLVVGTKTQTLSEAARIQLPGNQWVSDDCVECLYMFD